MNELFYGGFYGFEAAPFHTTPDASLLFATETHQQALGSIEYGISSGKGFIVITGEVGVGKTTVLRTCLDRLDVQKTHVIYIFNPDLNPGDLYQTILDELGTPPADRRTPTNPLHRLQRALLDAYADRQQVILAIDEAQNMPEATLEALRMLTNFETSRSKLIQIVLVGQPELEAILAKHSMRQLTQRIAVRARIRALTWRQSCRYIKHRVQCAGRTTTVPLFTLPALWYLAFRSKGIPRSINISCDNALISGYGAAAKRIPLKLAYDACQSLGQDRRSGRNAALATAGLLLAMILAVGVFRGRFVDLNRSDVASPGVASPGVGSPGVVTPAQNASGAVTGALAADNGASRKDAQGSVDPVAPAQIADGTPPPASPSTAATDDTTAGAPAAADPATTTVILASSAPSTAAVPGTTEDSAADPQVSKDSHSFWKWRVRRGDTLRKLCRATYGECDPDALRAIYASNPELQPNHSLRVGQVIVMPEQITARASD